MRVKKKWIIITFSSTNDAMHFESQCPIQGRLIPLPTSLSSGCGLAWKSELSLKYDLLDFLSNGKINYHQVVELML